MIEENWQKEQGGFVLAWIWENVHKCIKQNQTRQKKSNYWKYGRVEKKQEK